MIIDMHVHPFCREVLWDDLNKIADAMWGANPSKRKYMYKMLKNVSENVSIDDYITLMDEFEIEKAIIVSFNAKTAYDIILVSNDNIADLVALHPERLIGFAGLDFPSPNVIDDLDYAINSLNLKGVKAVPPVQKVDISDSIYDPIWKKMIDLNIPLWTHGGHQVSTTGSIAKFGHPMLIDEISNETPRFNNNYWTYGNTLVLGHIFSCFKTSKCICGYLLTPSFISLLSLGCIHELQH